MSKLILTGKLQPQEELIKKLRDLLGDQNYGSGFGTNPTQKLLEDIPNHINILLEGTETEVHPRFVLVAYLVKDSLESISPILEAISSNTQHPVSGMQALSLMHDSISDSYSKFLVFKHLVRIAASSSNLNLINLHLKKIESLQKHWKNVPQEEKDEFLWEVSQLNLKADLKTKFLMKYLSEGDNPNKERVEEAFAQVVNFGEVEQVHQVLLMPCLASLSGASSELVSIFSEASIGKFQDFKNPNSEYLAQKGFVVEKCLSVLKVLALCQIAKTRQEFTFEEAMETLQIQESEVDECIVKALSSGLFEARIDQIERKVRITRKMEEDSDVFWKELDQVMSKWEQRVK